MRYTDEIIQRVKDSTDIVAIVSEYVPLKKAGSSYKGLCPFHREKTPSFVVSPTRNSFHCFGCGKGGNAITFLMEMEKTPFPETLKLLAEKAGIALPKPREEAQDLEKERERQRLLDLHEFAGKFFYDQLTTPTGKKAVEYLKGRKITGETAKRFQIGYAPDAWDTLKTAALRASFTEKEMLQGGLLVQPEGKDRNYDKFRDRLIFPVRNNFGKIIAFGGRALGEGPGPKYLNSPETPIFNKGENLYLLDVARDVIRREGYVLVVEGYFDALTLHQNGFGNVVATMGTALTSDPEDTRSADRRHHAHLLKRYTNDVVLVYDADTAGQDAAVRGFEPLLSAGLRVRVLTLPDAKDPDEYLLKHKAEDLQALLKDAPGFFSWRAHALREQMRDKPEADQLLGLSRLAPLVIALPSEMEVQAACVAIEEQFYESDIKRSFLQIVNDARSKKGRAVPDTAPADAGKKARGNAILLRQVEGEFLALLTLDRAEYVKWAVQSVSPELFNEGDLKGLFEGLASGGMDAAQLRKTPALEPFFLQIESQPERYKPKKTLITQLYATLEMRHRKSRMAKLREDQQKAEKSGDIDQAADLGRQIGEIKSQLDEMDKLKTEPHD